jgi:hypothetical protein
MINRAAVRIGAIATVGVVTFVPLAPTAFAEPIECSFSSSGGSGIEVGCEGDSRSSEVEVDVDVDDIREGGADAMVNVTAER